MEAPAATGAAEYFRQLDSNFIGLSKAQDDQFLYKASDVLVQTTWELPIVIQWPNSSVSYEFSSTPSDISFGVVFVAAPEESQIAEDLEIETVEEVDRVPSGSELISGSFDVPAEGVIFFIWDNNFDWSAVKKLSYSITVNQPSFSLPDQDRCNVAATSLRLTVEDLHLCYSRHADAHNCMENNTANVAFIEDQIAQLQRKLTAKKEEFSRISQNISSWERKTWLLRQSKMGLCARMLNRHLLSYVLSFLPVNSAAAATCRYWCEVAQSAQTTAVMEAEKWYVGKMNKSEKTRQLFEIRLRQKALQVHQDAKVGKPASSPKENSSRSSSSPSDEIQRDAGRGSPFATSSDIQITYDTVLPQIAEGSGMRRSDPSRTAAVPEHKPKQDKTRSKSSSRRTGDRKSQTALLQSVQQIRSEQQLTSVVEFINSALLKIESIANEKRRVKKLIRAWNASYERKYGRVPSTVERKGHLRELHEEYQQLTVSLRTRQDKLDDVLKKVGLTLEQFEQLRNRKFDDL